jgi:hypothetical protein
MSSIRLHLEAEEYTPVLRYAEELGINPEDVLYCALNRLMEHADAAEVREDILRTRDWRRDNLPLWADPAHGVHAYESK